MTIRTSLRVAQNQLFMLQTLGGLLVFRLASLAVSPLMLLALRKLLRFRRALVVRSFLRRCRPARIALALPRFLVSHLLMGACPIRGLTAPSLQGILKFSALFSMFRLRYLVIHLRLYHRIHLSYRHASAWLV